MTIDEQLKMYREKKHFVSSIAAVFRRHSEGHSVVDITYELWHKETAPSEHDFLEWIIVHYEGGAKSACRVYGNSNTANFRAIGELLDGGDYGDNYWYTERQASLGYKKVDMAKLILTEVD